MEGVEVCLWPVNSMPQAERNVADNIAFNVEDLCRADLYDCLTCDKYCYPISCR
jgi:hypothetical protein